MPRLSLLLLGGFRAELHGQPITGFESNKVRALLAYLAVEAGRPHQRSTLAGLLWPDHPEDTARTNLRHVLRQLRKTLDERDETPPLVLADQQTIALSSASHTLDVARFQALREEAARCGHGSFETCDACLARYHTAADLYRGPFLHDLDLPDSDLFAEWKVLQRERLHRQALEIFSTLSSCYEQRGNPMLAREYAWRQLELEPWREEAHRQVMRALVAWGQRAEALAQYETCRRILHQELGIEPGVETQALREAIARGVGLPSAVRPTAGPTPTAVNATTLAAPIGREAEVVKLRTLWENAARRHGALVIIRGEAGVGKSHLARYLTEYVGQQGGLALVGHCYEFERALPYQAIVEMLRAAADVLRRADLPLTYRDPLARLAPDVLGLASGPQPEVEVAEADARAQLFEALLQAFLALARHQPLLVLLEDTHWAAESTLDWLTYITPRLVHSRLLVAITYRTSEVGADHALARLRRRFARAGAVTDLWVRPLSREANRALVAQLAGREPGQVDAVADRLFNETGGNPFFLEEIVRGLIETGQLNIHQGHWTGAFMAAPSADVALPESLREIIQARLERLPDMSRGFICAAAVAGRVFDYDIVQRAGGWTDELALNALEDLLARGFVCEAPDQGGFAFVHHLMQEAIYAALTRPRRSYLHRRLAEALQALRPHAVELAYHFAQSGDQERARLYYLEAGNHAREMAALSDAVQHYRAALERWPEHDRAGRAETLHRLGECQWLTGDAPGALQTFEAADALFEALGDRLKQAEMQRLIGLRHWDLADQAAATRHLRQALAILEQGPASVELARVMCSISGLHMMASEYEEAIDWGERALALAERLGAEGVTCYALVNIGSSWVNVHAQDAERGMTMLREGLRRALALGLPRDACRAYYELSEALTGQGRYAEARATAEEFRAYAMRTYVRPALGVAVARLMELDWLAGHWVSVLARRQELVAWVSSPWGIEASILLARIENDLGRADMARQELERTLPQAQAYGDLHRTAPHLGQLSRAYADLDMTTEVMALLDRLNHLVDQRRYLERRCLPSLLWACHHLSSYLTHEPPAAVYDSVGRLERADRQLKTPETAVMLAEGQGAVWLADKRLGEAATRLRQAAEQWAALGRPYDQARALRHLGQALAQVDEVDAARRAFDQALTLFDALLAQLADDALRRAFLASAPVRETRDARARLETTA